MRHLRLYFRHPCSCVRGTARLGGACPRHSTFGFLRLSHVRSHLGAVRRVWLGPQPTKRDLAPRHICSLRPDLFPFRLWAVGNQMLQLAIGVLIVFLTIELGRRWFNRTVGLIAGLLVALWPVFIEYTTIIGSEMLFTAALLGVLLLFDEICSNERHLTLLAVVFGGLIGFATLLRPTAISSRAACFSVLFAKASNRSDAQTSLYIDSSYPHRSRAVVSTQLCLVR